MTDPDLSETVPEKLPVACPYSAGDRQNAAVLAITKKSSLLPITTPPKPFVISQPRRTDRSFSAPLNG
jgi:hypothetical protein